MKKPILPSNAAWRDAAGKQLPTEFWRWFRDLSAYVDRPDTTTPPPEPVEPDLSDYSIIGMGSVFSIGSLADKSVILQLVNDQDSPAPSYYYGTDDAGAKGWHAISDALEAATDELTKAVDPDTGVTTFGLADVPDAGAGTLQLTQFDAKGRCTGTADATASDQTISGTWQFANGVVAGSYPAGPLAALVATPSLSIVFGDGSNLGLISPPTLTDTRTWTLPDASGTIALASDIPAPTPALHYRRDDLTAAAGDNLITLDQEPYEDSLEIFKDGVLSMLADYSRTGTEVDLASAAAGGEVFSVRYWSELVAAASTISTAADLEALVIAIFASLSAQGGMYRAGPDTCFQDDAGTTPAAVGDPVGYIADLSGNGNHMVQATSAARPVLRQDGSGYYYLEFDGVDDSLASTASITFGVPFYFALAGERLDGAGQLLSVGTILANSVGIFNVTSGRFRLYHRVGGTVTQGDTSAIGSWADNTLRIVEIFGEAGACEYWIDGASALSGALSLTGAETITGVIETRTGSVSTYLTRFYGGIALDGDPTADRDTIADWLSSITGVAV